jgi:stearoyl-CoA desaturase (delta-9 desaturase)
MSGKARSSVEAASRRSLRRHVLLITVLPLAGFSVAVASLWGRFVGKTELFLMAVMWTVTGLAGTAGFHRLFAHRAFEARRSVRLALAIVGSMAAQGPVIYWVALHRKHHRFSDRYGDPTLHTCAEVALEVC